MAIEVRKPAAGELEEKGILSWPVWSCEASTFDWEYDQRETCYLLAGEVTVEADGEVVSFGAGDLAVFPEGLQCTWRVARPVRKHYQFG